MPFAMMSYYLCWSPQKFQSCRNNGLFTGGLAFGLDIMTFVGIMEVLLQKTSGNKDTSWHVPTIMYCVVISALFVALFGWHSEYGKRIKPGSCEIDDEADEAADKLRDKRPELYTGVLMSVTSIVFYVYLKMSFSEISCCATYPALLFLGFDVLIKLQVWKRGEALVGDALHRSFIYLTVQALDVALSSSSLGVSNVRQRFAWWRSCKVARIADPCSSSCRRVHNICLECSEAGCCSGFGRRQWHGDGLDQQARRNGEACIAQRCRKPRSAVHRPEKLFVCPQRFSPERSECAVSRRLIRY